MQQQQPDWELKINNDESLTRTICVRFTGIYTSVHDLYGLFKRYGEVQSVRIDKLTYDQHIGLIEFSEAGPAKELVMKNEIIIEKKGIEITLLNEKYPQVHIPNVRITENVGTVTKLRKKIWKFMRFSRKHNFKCPMFNVKLSKNIVNTLNEDCLHEIVKKLDLLSISNVANVCTRFNQIAKQVFQTKYGRHISFSQLKDNGFSTSQVISCLRNFGSLVKSLTLDKNIEHFDSYNNRSVTILRMINEHGRNLNKLIITYNLFNDSQKLNEINSLLSQLKVLEIDLFNSYSNNGIEEFIAVCHQLESLKVMIPIGGTTKISFQKFTLPNLVELRLVFCKLDGLSLQQFLRRNSQLKKLEIRTYSLIDIDSLLIFQLIGHELPNLQELIFERNELLSQDFNAGQITHLSYLKNLKILKIDFQSVNILSLMQPFSLNNKSIEYFEAMRASIDDTGIGIICQMKSINRIDLHSCERVNVDHLIRLAKNLQNLKTLHVYPVYDVTSEAIKTILKHANQLSNLSIDPKNVQSFVFNAIDYNEVVEIVKKRIIHTKLYIEFFSTIDNEFSAAYTNKLIVFDMYPDWLTVEKNYNYYNRL